MPITTPMQWRRLPYGRLRRLVTIIIAVLWICGLVACGSDASRLSDSGSTATYLTARSTRERAVQAELGSSRAAIERYVADAQMRCPGIVAKAPRNAEFGELSYDALLAVAVTVEQANSEAISQFGHSTADLSWDKTRLTALVRRLAQEERDIARIIPPDVCSELTEWTQSGYRRIPATARRFQQEASALARLRAATGFEQTPAGTLTGCRRVRPHGHLICSVRPLKKGAKASPSGPTSTVIWKLLKPYEDEEQQRTARETEELEGSVGADTSGTLISAMSTLTHDLGLDPAALHLYTASLPKP